jgi:hypothetical protein
VAHLRAIFDFLGGSLQRQLQNRRFAKLILSINQVVANQITKSDMRLRSSDVRFTTTSEDVGWRASDVR